MVHHDDRKKNQQLLKHRLQHIIDEHAVCLSLSSIIHFNLLPFSFRTVGRYPSQPTCLYCTFEDETFVGTLLTTHASSSVQHYFDECCLTTSCNPSRCPCHRGKTLPTPTVNSWISSQIPSRQQYEPNNCATDVFLTAIDPIQLCHYCVRSLPGPVSPSSDSLLPRPTAASPCIRPKNKTCGREACTSPNGQRDLLLVQARQQREGTLPGRSNRPRCGGLPALHENVEKHVFGLWCRRPGDHVTRQRELNQELRASRLEDCDTVLYDPAIHIWKCSVGSGCGRIRREHHYHVLPVAQLPSHLRPTTILLSEP